MQWTWTPDRWKPFGGGWIYRSGKLYATIHARMYSARDKQTRSYVYVVMTTAGEHLHKGEYETAGVAAAMAELAIDVEHDLRGLLVTQYPDQKELG